MKSIKNKRILLSPLNWGLGHVTRTIPIIQQLLNQENEIFICCNSTQKSFYKPFFPFINYLHHEGYPFTFKGRGNWTIDLIKSYSPLKHFLNTEREKVKTWVKQFSPDLIISDQRFGFYHTAVKSVLITHQLNLPVPKWNFFAHVLNNNLINQFDEIWVPDEVGNLLSGKLSETRRKNVFYLGYCSRFKLLPDISYAKTKKTFKYAAIISGPEPYAGLFLELIMNKLKKIRSPFVIIVGKGVVNKINPPKNCTIFIQPDHDELTTILLSTEIIISRSGYSTLMDLSAINKKAILIPTKGQGEQLYLAKFHSEHPNWKFVNEKTFQQMVL